MKKALIWIFTALFLYSGQSKKWTKILDLKQQASPHYTLYLPSDMKFDEKGNVYVLDFRGCFLRKYSREGKFLGEAGRKGNGPGEFRAPFKIFVEGGRVYVWDINLKRLSVFDAHLNYMDSYHLPFNINDFFLHQGKIYASVSSPHELANIFVIDMKGKVLRKILPGLPPYLRKDKWLFLNKVRFGFMLLGYNRNLKIAAVTFRGYDPRNFLYVFSPGKTDAKIIPLNFIKNYKFPDFLLRVPLKYPPRSVQILVESLHVLDRGDFLIVLLKKEMERKKAIQNETLLIILSEEGKVLSKKVLQGVWRVYDVKGCDVLLKNMEDEDEIFQIWRMSYEK